MPTQTFTTAAPRTRSHLTRAVLWMGLALVSFSVTAVAGREAGRTMPTNELIFWRSAFGVIVLTGIYCWRSPGIGKAGTTVLPLHLARALVHYGAQYSWLFALTLIPLTELFALEFTAPLWLALLAPLLLGEKLSGWRMLAAAIGFVGAIVVIEPGIFAGQLQMTVSTGTLFAAASGIGFACSMIMTKRLTRVDPPLRILFWMQVLQVGIATALLAAGGVQNGHWPLVADGTTPLQTWLWIGVLGLSGLGAHFGLTRAFSLADAIIVAPMDFLRLPLIATIGMLLYGENLRPGVMVGAAIVVIGNTINIWAERRAKQTSAPTARAQVRRPA